MHDIFSFTLLRARHLCAGLVAGALFAGAIGYAHAAKFEQAEIITKTGVKVFQVEIALTPEEHQKGLMFRKSLAEGTGMLFDFGEDQEVVMWMKNTYIPLDMLFIRRDGTISHIAENTTPFSEAHINSGGLVKGVLEVAAGTVRKYGIAVGDKVGHRFFNGR